MEEHLQPVLKSHKEWVGLFLQGSQNYNLDYEGSDIDTKVIVIPNFTDFVLNAKPISTTHIMENDEHVDFKDIRLMFDCIKKQNVNFVEILFTPYLSSIQSTQIFSSQYWTPKRTLQDITTTPA